MSGSGYGMACEIDSQTYVAEILEISLDKASGRVKVKLIVAAQEMESWSRCGSQHRRLSAGV